MNDPGTHAAADRPDVAELVAQLRADGGRIADVAAIGPLDAPVPACPGWSVADLVGHLGGVHRWALHAVRHGTRPDERPGSAVPDGADPAEWFVAGVDELASALAEAPADRAAWNPFGAEQTVRFWARRQAHETMVHRWDVEAAIGSTTALPPVLASDAIDELFEVIVPHLFRRSDAWPSGSLHVHCTDVAGEWLTWIEGDQLVVRREHAKGDAAMRGPAEALALHLWGRLGELEPPADVVGDAEVAASWARLTG